MEIDYKLRLDRDCHRFGEHQRAEQAAYRPRQKRREGSYCRERDKRKPSADEGVYLHHDAQTPERSRRRSVREKPIRGAAE